jgi:type I restriction enzyme S subunit
MKDNWSIKRLGEMCQLISGQHIEAKYCNSEARGVGYLTGPSNFGPLSPTISRWSEYPKVKARKGDVLLTVKGSGVGKINLLDQNDIAISRQLMSVRATGVDPAYLHAFLSSTFEHFQSVSTGAAIPGISRDQVLDLRVACPPPEEQRRIVRVLDKAFAGIATVKANAEKNIENASSLFENYLHAILLNKKWEHKRIADVCSSVEYGSSAKSRKVGKVAVLRMGNIQNGIFDWGDLVYSNDVEEIEKYLLSNNDVLFNRTNSPALVGKTAIYRSEMPAIFAGYLIRIHRKGNLLDAEYLNYFLNSEMARNHGKSVAISSVNQANINGAKLMDYPIPVPPLQEQRYIVEKLNNLKTEGERLESIYTRKLNALDALKKSLLHQAFSGNL